MSLTVDTRPSASVVICTYSAERWNLLLAAVRAAVGQCGRGDEVIVVVDHNPELLARLARQWAEVIVVANDEGQGLSGARNAGVRAASHEVIVFLDDDAVPADGWLDLIVGHFADRSVAGVGGWVRPDWQEGEPRWWPRTFNWVVGCSYVGLPPGGGSLRNPIGASMALRRPAIERAGFFRSGVGRVGARPHGCEETELCIRIRQEDPATRIVHEERAVVDHHVPASRHGLGYFTRRCYAEGISKAIVAHAVGTDPSLASERVHALKTIPGQAAQDLTASGSGVTKAAAALLGLAVTSAGFVRGCRQLRHHDPGGGAPT